MQTDRSRNADGTIRGGFLEQRYIAQVRIACPAELPDHHMLPSWSVRVVSLFRAGLSGME